jgi:hypothetical protein
VFSKVLGILAVLALKRARDDMRQVPLGWHTSRARLSFERGGILLGQANRQVHKLPSQGYSP